MANLVKTVTNAGEVGIKCFGYNFSCCGVQGYYSEVNNGDGRGAAAIKKFDEEKVDHSPLPSRRTGGRPAWPSPSAICAA